MDNVYRGRYMSAHVLLNSLNKLGKSNKMPDMPSILSLAMSLKNSTIQEHRMMLDSIYQMKLRLLRNLISGVTATLLWRSFHTCKVKSANP